MLNEGNKKNIRYPVHNKPLHPNDASLYFFKEDLIRYNITYGAFYTIPFVVTGLVFGYPLLAIFACVGILMHGISWLVFKHSSPDNGFSLLNIFYSIIITLSPLFWGAVAANYILLLGMIFLAYFIFSNPKKVMYFTAWYGTCGLIYTGIVYFNSIETNPHEGIFNIMSFVLMAIYTWYLYGFYQKGNREVQAMLISRENTLNTVLNSTEDNVWSVEFDGSVIAINEAAHQNFKEVYQVDLQVGEKIPLNLLPEKIRSQYSAYFKRAFAGESFNVFHDLKASEHTRFFAVNFSPIRNAKNKIIGCNVFSKEVTHIKEIEGALKKSTALYQNLFDYNFDAIFIYNQEKECFIDCNQAACEIFGYESKKEFLQLHKSAIAPTYQKDNALTKDIYNNIVNRKQKAKLQFEFLHQRKNGEVFESEVSILPILDNPNEVITVVKDISEKRRAEAIIQQKILELNQKNKDLERYIESNLQLENFAYMASHDLKEPLKTILGFSKLLEKSTKDKLNQEEQEFLQFIVNGTKSMEQLIKDLLAYSRVDSQKINITKLNTLQLLEEVQFDLKSSIEEQKAQIEINQLPPFISGDKTQLRQLFQNLIANAIKFRQPVVPPFIKIWSKDLGKKWEFIIEDNGIGILPEYYEKIFLLFRKLHARNKYEGTGIGLAICKKIIEQHKGKIWVKPTSSGGTAFHFTIKKQFKKLEVVSELENSISSP